mmetsp:Transcript_8268/g.33463  ORF Transcript_8268/g.33463 Transcript_8268/m.33463 type:complete len:345 (+) Transcript_8268:89-1123(+)
MPEHLTWGVFSHAAGTSRWGACHVRPEARLIRAAKKPRGEREARGRAGVPVAGTPARQSIERSTPGRIQKLRTAQLAQPAKQRSLVRREGLDTIRDTAALHASGRRHHRRASRRLCRGRGRLVVAEVNQRRQGSPRCLNLLRLVCRPRLLRPVRVSFPPARGARSLGHRSGRASASLLAHQHLQGGAAAQEHLEGALVTGGKDQRRAERLSPRRDDARGVRRAAAGRGGLKVRLKAQQGTRVRRSKQPRTGPRGAHVRVASGVCGLSRRRQPSHVGDPRLDGGAEVDSDCRAPVDVPQRHLTVGVHHGGPQRARGATGARSHERTAHGAHGRGAPRAEPVERAA